MTRQINSVEVSTFVAGLITEASPLTFPANASLDEDNFVLNRDGSRQRRLGMDLEEGAIVISTGISPPADGNVATSSVRWNNAGGNPDKDLIVLQIGNELRFFDSDAVPTSAGYLHLRIFGSIGLTQQFSYAIVDGTLIVATGQKEVSVFKYAAGVVSSTDSVLYIRDQFGLADVVAGVNLRQGNGVTIRPTVKTDAHIYNLRNQTFAQPRKIFGPETVKDTIQEFFDKASSKYPSNSDTVTYALYADTNDSDDRNSERFNAKDVVTSPVGTFPAPKGYFIIDAMARGTSRLTEYNKLMAQYPELTIAISSLPLDTTPGGPTVVSEYAGRVFYSGFSGELVGPDDNSPRMSSYVLFSQLVEDPTDITTCYQDGDPTSKETPDLLDTDGGFIRIEGAYNILRLINVGNALAVLAANGVWLIQGGSDFGFKATNYITTKVTNHGCDSPGSVVVVDNTFMYWSDDGIYNVAPNQFAEYIAENVSKKTVQKFYDNIDGLDRRACKGVYDTYEKKIRWLYGGRISSTAKARELILDTTLGAFYPSTIGQISEGSRLPLPLTGVIVPPFRTLEIDAPVTVSTVTVTVGGSPVTVTENVTQAVTKEVIYAVLTSTSPTLAFTFGAYRDQFHSDWRSVNGVGVDAESFLLTGYQSAGDYQRSKQVPYLTTHFSKTESGFFADVNGDLFPLNPSSCLVQAQWDWANSANSGKWSREFQTYKFRRHYIPQSDADLFDNGYATVQSRNKLRGQGKVLSLLFKSEPEKHLHLLGWSMIMGVNSNV
jgi:hypothetical protein